MWMSQCRYSHTIVTTFTSEIVLKRLGDIIPLPFVAWDLWSVKSRNIMWRPQWIPYVRTCCQIMNSCGTSRVLVSHLGVAGLCNKQPKNPCTSCKLGSQICSDSFSPRVKAITAFCPWDQFIRILTCIFQCQMITMKKMWNLYMWQFNGLTSISLCSPIVEQLNQ